MFYRTDNPAADYARYSRDVVEPAEALAELQEKFAEPTVAAFKAPLASTIGGYHANDGKPIVVSHELVAWVLDTAADPHATLAEAMFDTLARNRLVDRFIDARAEREVDDFLAKQRKFSEAA